MATNGTNSFALSVKVTKISKKDTNLPYVANVSMETSEGSWTFAKSFKDIETFHGNLSSNDSFRGLNFPQLPDQNNALKPSKKHEYTKYFSSILRRSVLLGSAVTLDFIQAPETFKSAAKQCMENEKQPLKEGMMKKEGEKWRGYRSRYIYIIFYISYHLYICTYHHYMSISLHFYFRPCHEWLIHVIIPYII